MKGLKDTWSKHLPRAGSMACPLGGFVGSLFGLLLGRHCSTENALANAWCGDDLDCWLSGWVKLGGGSFPICLRFTFLKPEVAEFHSAA